MKRKSYFKFITIIPSVKTTKANKTPHLISSSLFWSLLLNFDNSVVAIFCSAYVQKNKHFLYVSHQSHSTKLLWFLCLKI